MNIFAQSASILDCYKAALWAFLAQASKCKHQYQWCTLPPRRHTCCGGLCSCRAPGDARVSVPGVRSLIWNQRELKSVAGPQIPPGGKKQGLRWGSTCLGPSSTPQMNSKWKCYPPAHHQLPQQGAGENPANSIGMCTTYRDTHSK